MDIVCDMGTTLGTGHPAVRLVTGFVYKIDRQMGSIVINSNNNK